MNYLKQLACCLGVLIFLSCTKESSLSYNTPTANYPEQQQVGGWGLNNWFTWIDIGNRKEPACPPFPKDCFDEIIVHPLETVQEIADGGNFNEPEFYLNYLKDNSIEYYNASSVISELLKAVDSGSLSVTVVAENNETDPFDKRYLLFQEPGKGVGDEIHTAFQFVIERGTITE